MAMDLMQGRAAPGPPPDLAAMLGGGPQQAPPATGDQGQGDPVAIVSNMLDLASQYLQVEPDEEDKLLMQKVTTQLQQLLAKDQADADGAMQGNLNPRTLRKALSA